MIFCRFGSNFHELSFPAPARGCQSLADVKNEYEALGYCIYHQVDDGEGCKEVMKYPDLPIIADESCIIEEDIAKCFNHFHGVNIKLMKCGGLTPGLRMIHKAKALGLKTMVGCMTESTVGISAIAHLLPLLDYVDMDGALLLEIDIATGVSIDFGKTIYSNENGTGAKLMCQ